MQKNTLNLVEFTYHLVNIKLENQWPTFPGSDPFTYHLVNIKLTSF